MKLSKQDTRPTIVVDFSRGSINMAAAESAGEAVRFRGITQVRMPQPDEQGYDPDEVVRRIAGEVERRGWRGMRSACLLSRSATSTQSFLFPRMPDEDLRQAIALKLDETLHFDLEEARFDFRRVRTRRVDGVDRVLTLVAVARKDAVDRAVDVLRRAGLRPIAVSAASESLANLTYYASPCDAEDATVHVDICSESTILNLFEGRLLRFSREIDLGQESFVQALTRPILTPSGTVQLSHAQASDVLAVGGYPQEEVDEALPFRIRSSDVLPLVEPVAQRLAGEIRQSAQYLASILDRPKIDYVVFSGSGSQLRRLDEQLEESLDVPVVKIDPVARAVAHWRLAIVGETTSAAASFSAILGYSLGDHRPINLLPPEPKRLTRPVTLRGTRKMGVPGVLAVGAALSVAAVPLQERYNDAYDRMLEANDHLDERLAEESVAIEESTRVSAAEDAVRERRAPLVPWSGILKELGHVLPEDAHVVEVSSSTREGRAFLHVVGRLGTGGSGVDGRPFEARVTALALALGRSPLIRAARTGEAVEDDPAGVDRFELELELEAIERGEEDAR